MRATQRAAEGAALDGLRAHQIHLVPSDREAQMPREVRRRRDELELAIESLRQQKAALEEGDYYARLEPLLLDLARLYTTSQQASTQPATSAAP